MIESFVKMKKDSLEKHVGCIAFASKILGDKWTPLIIKNLYSGKLRFSQLHQATTINPRTLSARLDFLEQTQIISRTMYAQIPPRVEYELTAKGLDLIPILKSMAEWGEKYK